MEKNKKYYLGLDIGTDSVGWCVTDQDYHIVTKRAVRKKADGTTYTTKKHLWGARLFSPAITAAKRRQNRANRRRLGKRRWRLLLLQEIFAPEMEKVDPTFFDRLNNSFLRKEDKPEDIQGLPLFFPDIPHGDARFRETYPTIFHLRKDLIDHPEKRFDLREVYLALAHMVKYRGNFLTSGDIKGTGTDADDLVALFSQLDETLGAIAEEEEGYANVAFGVDKEKALNLINAFKEEARKRVLKERELDILSIAKSKEGYDLRTALLELANGSTKKLSALFPDLQDSEEADDINLCFESDTFDQDFAAAMDLLSDEEAHLIEVAKSLRDFRLFTHLLQGKDSITEAMVELYDKHKEQLKKLKRLVKTYNHEAYSNFFRVAFKGKDPIENYVTYVGLNEKKGKVERAVPHATDQKKLYAAIQKLIPEDRLSEEDKAVWQEMKASMEAGDFLRRQSSKDNAVFPYQLHYNEMKAILENQGKYYPFLLEEDTDFRDPSRKCPKILSLLAFRIPYYVGPLSGDRDKDGKRPENHWMVRKEENVKITPWNFHSVVDKERSAQAFIDRMKNDCSYLLGEETLPRFSLRYCLFTVYNEMNNWLVNGQKITQEDKDYLIENVYLRSKKPTKSMILEALARKHNAASKEEIRLQTRSGSSLNKEDLHATLVPFLDFMDAKALGPDFYKDKALFEKAEQAIFDITLFEDGEMKAEQLSRHGFDKAQIDYLRRLRYTKWGKLSKKVLDGLRSPVVNPDTGEDLGKDMTILEILRALPLNFMEIYWSKNFFTFRKQVEDLNRKEREDMEEDIVDAAYASPAMKRALRQTLKLIAELKKILGIDSFDTYFVECTREESKAEMKKKKKRIPSRKSQLQDIYKACEIAKEEKDLSDLLNGRKDEDFRKDKLFLYFLQMGRSVYTGEPIDLHDLKNYDIDHILPQAKVKDGSMENKVLVERNLNIQKSDTYPIPKGIITEKGKQFIDFLYSKVSDRKHLLMSSEKRNRLLRPETKPLTDQELVGFVNRQLVLTSQSVKAVCDILKETDAKAHVVYSKASSVSGFRKAFGLVKCRDVNDFHHAHDAYLNIVVGNVYNKVFSSSFDVEALRRQREYYEGTKIDPEHFFKRDEYHVIAKDVVGARVWKAKKYEDEGRTVECPDSEGTIDLVRQSLSLQDPMVTLMPYRQKGLLRASGICSSRDGNAVLPLKATGPLAKGGYDKKYGGYNDLTAPYFTLVRSEGKKGKHVYSLENLPTILKSRIKTEKDALDYFKGLGLKNPEILLPVVPLKTVIEIFDEQDPSKKARISINSKSLKQIHCCNISQLHLPDEYVRYAKAISVMLGTNLPAGKEKPNPESFKKEEGKYSAAGVLVTAEGNRKFFDYLCADVFARQCYALLPGAQSVLEKIVDKKDIFYSLSTLNQVRVINHALGLLQTGNLKADLTLLGMGKDAGDIKISKNLKPGMRLLAQSPTGFYEKVLFTVPED